MADAPQSSPQVPRKPALVKAEALRAFAKAVFVKAGMPDDHAATVADVLVWANLRGQDGHGVMRIPRYVQWTQGGEINVKPNLRLALDLPAMVMLDADRACGPIAMTRATQLAIERARGSGVGLVMVRGTTHTAALGYYTLMIADAGMAGLSVAASIPNMAYHGMRGGGVSTSPLSIAVPGGDHGPIVFDMGTGVLARGKLMQAKRTGTPIPEGWALDKQGNPTTDPNKAEIPLPIAGPKGSGLALMIECITSLAVGNPILSQELEDGRPLRQRQNAFVMAIDLSRLGSVEGYRGEVDRLVRDLKAQPVDPEAGEILMPGERGGRQMKERAAKGIPIPPAIFDDIKAAADKLGVPMVETGA